jgi:hypothetical protein
MPALFKILPYLSFAVPTAEERFTFFAVHLAEFARPRSFFSPIQIINSRFLLVVNQTGWGNTPVFYFFLLFFPSKPHVLLYDYL